MNHHARNIKSIRLGTAFFLFLFMARPQAEMKEAGYLFYRGDPVELKDSTIRVPEKVMAMSEKVHVDLPPAHPRYTPSIFLLIQHSGSIETKDRAGKRFTFVQALIDNVKKLFPQTEMGIGIFRTYLYFDPLDNPRFVKAPGNDTGAYLPFFLLDSSYAPEGKTGYQIVYEMLDTVMINGTANLKYTPSNSALNPANTNINCGFDAVKHIFKSAKYSKNHQLVFFLSDGEATIANGPHTNALDYSQDTAFISDVPTTITAYFSDSVTPHQSLVKMTTNIRKNGYSYQNQNTALYPIISDYLMHYMINAIIPWWVQPSGKLLDMTINGKTTSLYDTSSKIFNFNNQFPLTGVATKFDYRINYKLIRDSIDTIAGDTISMIKDSTTNGTYTILNDPTVQNPPTNYKHLFDMISWNRELALYHNGNPVTLINKTMNNLELRFTYSPGEAQFHYAKADVEVTNSAGSIKEWETFSLTKNDTLFTKTFSLAIDSNPTPNNGVLQVREKDTIVAVFRNSESTKLPLDTLRIVVPFIATAAIEYIPINSKGTLNFSLIKNGVGNYLLKYSNLPADGDISLYTINGRKVFKQELIKGTSSINLPKRISPSVYVLQIYYNGNSYKKKLFLQ